MLSNLKLLVKKHLAVLDNKDYPKLNIRLFVYCWLNFILALGIESMRGLLKQLKWQGEDIDLSTFSKASKTRSTEVFRKVVSGLNEKLGKKYKRKELGFFHVYSTTVTLISKLLWRLGIHQFKLIALWTH